MIWPADFAAHLVALTGATGEVQGVIIMGTLVVWYGAVLGLSAALIGMLIKMWRKVK